MSCEHSTDECAPCRAGRLAAERTAEAPPPSTTTVSVAMPAAVLVLALAPLVIALAVVSVVLASSADEVGELRKNAALLRQLQAAEHDARLRCEGRMQQVGELLEVARPAGTGGGR